MSALSKLLELSPAERQALGVVHTLPEVIQQPETWHRTYEKIVGLAQPLNAFLTKSALFTRTEKPLTVLLIGAGTSDYIGKSVCALLQKEWCSDVHAIPSTDLLTNMEEHVIPGYSYLWISFSRSGDSSEGVAVLREALARYPQIKHLIVTCNRDGAMAREFEEYENVMSIVLDDEVNDRGLAMTSSFSNMVIVAQALAHIREPRSYESLLDKLASCATSTLPVAADVCADFVRQGFSKAYFLGSGPLKGAAIESALKVLELTDGRIISLSESFLGLRHGPLSAIDHDTLVVGFLSGDDRRRAFELDLIDEIHRKNLTNKSLLVFPTKSPDFRPGSLLLGFEAAIPDLYRPPVDVLVGQLLGFFASLKEGLKPDTPSPQGAINRVVSNVTIH